MFEVGRVHVRRPMGVLGAFAIYAVSMFKCGLNERCRILILTDGLNPIHAKSERTCFKRGCWYWSDEEFSFKYFPEYALIN